MSAAEIVPTSVRVIGPTLAAAWPIARMWVVGPVWAIVLTSEAVQASVVPALAQVVAWPIGQQRALRCLAQVGDFEMELVPESAPESARASVLASARASVIEAKARCQG
jgi:hypothetical protein